MTDMPRTSNPIGVWPIRTGGPKGFRCDWVSIQGHSPEGATVGTGQKEPRDSRQVLEDVQHQQRHVLGESGVNLWDSSTPGAGASVLTLLIPSAQ